MTVTIRRKARRPVSSAVVFLLLAACARGGETPADAASPTAASVPLVPSAVPSRPAPSPGVARKVADKTDAYEFAYSYPAQAGGIPALKIMLDRELDREKAELSAEGANGEADAKKHDYPFHAYSSQKDWSVVTDLPDWLSLSAIIYTYSGGAHGMTVFDTLLWDRRANRRRAPLDLFVSKAAFRTATAKPLCAALDRERTKRRGGELGAPDDEFSKCIDPTEDATVILGSSGHRRFDRIGFLIPPYNAGPYAEGTYELTLPVTPALIAAVRPEYRAAFGR